MKYKNRALIIGSALSACFPLVTIGSEIGVSDEEPESFFDKLYLNGVAGVALGKSNEESEAFGRIAIGYGISEYLDFQLASSHLKYSGFDNNNQTIEAAMRANFPVDDEGEVKFYLDSGVILNNGSATVGTGLLYKLSQDIDFDIGYRYYQEPNQAAQGDVYSLAIGLKYYFNDREPEKEEQYLSLNSGSSRPNQANEKSKIKNVELVNNKIKTVDDYCVEVIDNWGRDERDRYPLKSYKISQGDWPIRIAKQHYLTIEVLEEINSWLRERNKNKEYIFPGETLLIPNIRENQCTDAHGRKDTNHIDDNYYTILKGDWPLRIARRLGITLDELEKSNPWLKSRNRDEKYIYPGEILVFPSSKNDVNNE
ncbi:LysM peptidoglycan-binding domain-containing protein [Vibrio coralliirubri]|uniref:LysM peptidoglycan-binding domain-containing protein n=1 Tax=Vibrio coralliirubri TaxID=1516159 RepID=UPI0013C49407|nr:LysM peptidoglycan-binding domain-containing protein [Vibrio coralliirubri]